MPATPKLKTLKTLDIKALAPIAFYGLAGILFLVLLLFANSPPHIGVTGIMSLITAYSLFTKRSWAKWLVIALFFAATTLALCTLYYFIFSNWIVSISMITYAVLTWICTAHILLKSQPA
jgi:hypothetical protein